LLAITLARVAMAAEETRQALPPPVTEPRSTEICMNSRISYHGGWSGTATDQMLGDILHAAARAPTTGGPCELYVATAQNVYRYDAAGHALVLHQAGDERSDATAAFEIGFAAANSIDAGAAMHLAQLESIALWTGTSGQLASCPRGTAANHANNYWNPITPIDIVVSFGMRSVAGFTSTLVAVSSDGSLSNPVTDGSVPLDDALAGLGNDTTFAAQELTPAEISQLLWAAYGCSDHRASWISGTAGLVCSSALATYYLTRHIYAVQPDGVYRYHVRRPPGTDATTRDHRIERVSAGDVRPALRAAVPALPEAPFYLILCLTGMGNGPELEVGFAAVGAMTEASSLGLRGHTLAAISGDEEEAIRDATGIPSTDIPVALVSLGHPSEVTGVELGTGADGELRLWIVRQAGSSEQVTICYTLPTDAPVTLSIYDALGHRVRDIAAAASGTGFHTVAWDCRDDRRARVPSGVYFCRLASAGQTMSARALVVR
jgi:hypothetical protein